MPVLVPVLGAAIVGGASIYAANKASSAAKQASAAQTESNNAALAEQARQYDQTRADQAPWREAGSAALEQLSRAFGLNTGPNGTNGAPDASAFTTSPGYEFRRNESLRAVTGNYAARGLLESGNIGKGLIDYAGNAASQEFGNWFNQLSGIAGVGQTATQATSAAGANAANQRTGILQNEGEQRASSIATRGGIGAGLIGQLGGTLGGLITNYSGGVQTMVPQAAPISAIPESFIPMQTPNTSGGLITPGSLWGSVL